jgi:hypothetical protein
MNRSKRKKSRKRIIYFNTRKLLRLKNEDQSSKDTEEMEFIQMPDILPKHLSKEERRKLIKEGAENAKREFENKYRSLQKWFNEYDPIYLLSFCAYYFLSYPEGQDPELTGKIKFHPYFIEILQAFALCETRNYFLKPLMQESEKLELEVKEIGDLLQFSWFSSLREVMTDEEMAAHELRMDMILQTMAIRNRAYPYQMIRIVKDLSKLVDDKYRKIFPIDLSKFMETIYRITAEREDLLNEHLSKVRLFWKKDNFKEMIETYNQLFPENTPVKEDQIEEIWNMVGKKIEHLKGLLVFHSDLKIENIYSFSLDHFASLYGDKTKKDLIKTLLDKLSYQLGDLKDHPKEYFVLDNPVHRRPFIKVDDEKYYCAIFYIMPHLMLGLLEQLIGENEELRKEYNDKIKPRYLENKVSRLFRTHFPNAKIYQGSEWHDPMENKTYENDLTAIIDTFAIVVEAKSGGIAPPAKRGAPQSLFDTLTFLVDEPSEQAQRFISYLSGNKKLHELTNKRGEVNNIDSSKINYYIPVGVTLSSLGVIGSNLKILVEAGLTRKNMSELAMSISLTDLECVFEILNYEAEYIHYFSRRREFDVHVNYEGDELDLLNFYLGNGFNIGEAEFDEKNSFLLVAGSKNLDPYFIERSEGKRVDKPKHKISNWWEDILLRLSTKKPKNWIETSFILLNTTKTDQIKFEQGLKGLIKRINSGDVEKKHNWAELDSGPEKRKFMIVGYPYNTRDKEERNAMIGTIINSADSRKIKGIVVIGIDLNRNDYPYSVLAGKLDTNLFCL